MPKTIIPSDNDSIFATGVFLQAIRCKINNKWQWRWVAVGFEDDSYFDGEIIDVCEYSETHEDLFVD